MMYRSTFRRRYGSLHESGGGRQRLALAQQHHAEAREHVGVLRESAPGGLQQRRSRLQVAALGKQGAQPGRH